MHKRAWTKSAPLILAMFLTSCTPGSSERRPPLVITPDVVPFSDTFQAQLAVEMEADARVPCPRDILVPDCSAWKRAVLEFSRMRDQARGAKGR